MKFSAYVLPWRRSALSECSCLDLCLLKFLYSVIARGAFATHHKGTLLFIKPSQAPASLHTGLNLTCGTKWEC